MSTHFSNEDFIVITNNDLALRKASQRNVVRFRVCGAETCHDGIMQRRCAM